MLQVSGKWQDLSINTDGSNKKACLSAAKRPGHGISGIALPSYNGESWLSDNLFEVIEAVSELDENEQEAFYVWLNDGNRDMDTEDLNGLIDSFRDDYQGNYKDEEDYAYEIIEQCYDLPEFALSYFDYEKFARDLFMTDYWFEDGHVFRRA